MTSKVRKRRDSSVEHRSTRRRKATEVQPIPVYSTRSITWDEQLSLPSRFHEERNVWPALRILQARGTGRKREYLLEWEAHPRTGEVFEPTWEPVDNVGQELKQEWNRSVATASSPTSSSTTSAQVSSRPTTKPKPFSPRVTNRRINNRRIIPDSSADTQEVEINNSASSSTPTLTGSPVSARSVPSPIEISETQPNLLPKYLRVNVPPAPPDKSDWESLRESQFSNFEESPDQPSPFVNRVWNHKAHRSSQASPEQGSDQFDTIQSAESSAAQFSERPRVPASRNRGEAIGRILDYQSSISSPSPDTAYLQFSTAPAQPDDSPDLFHASEPPSGIASGSKAIEQQPQHYQDTLNRRRKDLTPKSNNSSAQKDTQPWVFKLQIPLGSQSSPTDSVASSVDQPVLSGRCARKSTNPASQEPALTFSNIVQLDSISQPTSHTGMAARNTRQSPRLSAALPAVSTSSPRIVVRTGNLRNRSGINPPEHSSPLAVTSERADPSQIGLEETVTDNSFHTSMAADQNSSSVAMMPPTSIPPSAMHIDPAENALLVSMSQDSSEYNSALNTLHVPVHESIEEEIISSAEETSLASKASSSQESLRNERLVPQVDGLVMPTYPILGEDEYALALPAEGKVQAIYSQTIKVKKKAVLKFIRRRGSVNTASTSTTKTVERNEMIELIDRLHDTTTHIDLGLPGIPTQYTIPAQEHAAYAEYAGSKFVFLGYLMDLLQRRHETIVIMAKSGATQDLLEEYLYMKNVRVRRHERSYNGQNLEENTSAVPQVELLSTKPNNIVQIDAKPSLIIAFDASFEALDPQVKNLRSMSEIPIPILHLLVTNSSEHVERCLPPSMPSPIRLRLLVRATYQAHMNLGGSPTIITNPSDELEGRPMDLGDINRAVRKSPNRRLQMVAAVVANATLSDDFAGNWTLSSIPELALDELDESPSTGSTVSATPGRSRARSQTPILKSSGQARNRSRTPVSRAGTPSARKRQLEVDTSGLVSKRQRMTPVTEFADGLENDVATIREQEMHRQTELLRVELANERKAKQVAEQAQEAAEMKALKWQIAHASLQRRYEKRTKKSQQQTRDNYSLTVTVESSKARVDKVMSENTLLRQQNTQLKKELESARNDLQSNGGDIAALEVARQEAREAVAKNLVLEKSLDNTKRDFEFLRTQYQDASNKAAGLGSQLLELEGRVRELTSKASDEKRRLKELNHAQNVEQHLARIQQLEAEKKSIMVLYRKLEEESKLLKRNRGVQTRGSSTAPGSPGQRSRQGSPAPGNLAPPSGSRASALRHER